MAARLVRLEFVAAALEKWRLPSYSDVLALTRHLADDLSILEFWPEVFHEDPPDERGFDLELEFVRRIHHEKFPLALWVYDDYFHSGMGEEMCVLLGVGIVVPGRGCAWDVLSLLDIEPPMQPVVAGFEAIWIDEHYGRAGDRFQALRDWWGETGYAEPPYPLWAVGCEREEWDETRIQAAEAVLEELEPPLDGLAVALRCCTRNTGNFFIDFVDPYWQGEYGIYIGELPWSIERINHLTYQWDQVREHVARLEAYQKWYDAHPVAARERVAEIMMGLDERLGLVEGNDDERE